MGRKKKYLILDEKKEAQRKYQMDHYWRNCERLRKENLNRYYGKKNKSY
jgi:hypothetical protein